VQGIALESPLPALEARDRMLDSQSHHRCSSLSLQA
jgi:hypothetical protein